ncbi:MAG: HAMP domain-containing sensor histidine kinase [Spirochaetota bacterium]
MILQGIVTPAAALWDWFTEPHASLTGRKRERARTLTALLLGLFTLCFLAMILVWLGISKSSSLPGMPAAAVIAVAYSLSRTRHSDLAFGLTLVSLSAGLFIMLALHYDDESLRYLAIPIMLSSIFLSIPGTIAVAAAQICAFFLFSFFFPSISTLVTPGSVFSLSVIGILAMLIAWGNHRNHDEISALERSARQSLIEAQGRTDKLLESIVALAQLDFTHPAHMKGDDSVYDAMAAGFNMLGEELASAFETIKVQLAELQSSNASLVLARIEAESANRATSLFFNNISHEFRTALNAIMGNSQLLGRGSSLTEGQREMLSTIYGAGDQLLGMVTELMDYSRLEASPLAVEKSSFDLRATLDDLAMSARQSCDARGLDLLVELSLPEACFVVSDVARLSSILRQLLDNAIIATERGRVSLRAAILPDRTTVENAVATTVASLRLVVEVEDSGSGFTNEEAERIFEAMSRPASGFGDKSRTGLALALGRRFIELMGGSLAMTSQSGRGSTFRLELPVGRGEASATAPRTAAALKFPEKPVLTQVDFCADVAALPEALRAGLREAALCADIERILALAGDIEGKQAGVAFEIRRLAKGFEYRGLITLIENGEGEWR